MEDSKAMTLQRSAKPKPRKCAICRTQFMQLHSFHKLCGKLDCGIAFGEKSREKSLRIAAKAERADIRARKDKRKTPSERAEPAQASINRYVNIRDHGKPCISCGKPDRGVRNASHYKSRGSNSALRFHLWNITSACYRCNKELSGNIAGYIAGLNDRHPGRIEWLNNHPRSREYPAEYLKRITRIFNKKALRAEKRIRRMA
jgi:hypothetical protein